MKKAIIIFIILFAATILIPMISMTGAGASSTENEMVTIFNSAKGIIAYQL